MVDDRFLQDYDEPKLDSLSESYRLIWRTMNAYDVCIRLFIDHDKYFCVSKQIRVLNGEPEFETKTLIEISSAD